MQKPSRLERRMQKKETRQEEVAAQRAHFAKRKRNKRIMNYAIIDVLAVVIGYGLFTLFAPGEEGRYDALAKCMTAKGATMYGTNWCPHCQDQKRLFGASFKYINFVDCDISALACEAAGVE